MIGDHFEDDELLAYLDANSNEVDLPSIERHLEHCESDCRERLEWLGGFIGHLGDETIHRFAKRLSDGTPPPELVEDARLRGAQRTTEDARGASLLQAMKALPTESWFAHAAPSDPSTTAGLLRRMTGEAREEFDRRPRRALEILNAAEPLAQTFPDALDEAEHRGAIARERAEALRMLGRHREALQSLDAAEQFLAQLPAPTYDLAFVDWVRAAVLFYLTRYDEALFFARKAGRVFREHGDLPRAEQMRIIEANVLCEQGDIEGAHRMFTRLVLFFSRADDQETIARLNANLAECEVRLDRRDVAYEYAADAMRMYEALGLETERVRVRWILGHALMRQEQFDEALEELRAAADDFADLGMHDAVAGVGLDIVELHLAREDWALAEELARRLADNFAAAGAPLHTARAFAYLRDAVNARSASLDLLEYLRSYLAIASTEDMPVPFDPP